MVGFVVVVVVVDVPFRSLLLTDFFVFDDRKNKNTFRNKEQQHEIIMKGSRLGKRVRKKRKERHEGERGREKNK